MLYSCRMIGIKTNIRTYTYQVFANFHGLNIPEDDTDYESFMTIFIDSLLVY